MRLEPVAVIAALATASGISPDDVAVLFACIAGAYSSFSWRDKPIEPRSRMWRYGIACIIVGWAFTILVNALIMYFMPGFHMIRSVQAALGAFVSCIAPFIMEWLVKTIREGSWLQYIPFLRKRGE
jgi:hypothetical protein